MLRKIILIFITTFFLYSCGYSALYSNVNYKDINSPIPNDCEPPFIFEYENIYVEGSEIRRASDDYVIKRFNAYDDKLILYLPDANHYFQSSQRFHFIKQ